MKTIIASFDKPIYIGDGHSSNTKCLKSSNPEYKKISVTFRLLNGKEETLIANCCTKCGKIFLPYKVYARRYSRFDFYTFICAGTGNVHSLETLKIKGLQHSKLTESSDFNKFATPTAKTIKYHDYFKTPTYIKKGLQRPLYGGSCAPR